MDVAVIMRRVIRPRRGFALKEFATLGYGTWEEFLDANDICAVEDIDDEDEDEDASVGTVARHITHNADKDKDPKETQEKKDIDFSNWRTENVKDPCACINDVLYGRSGGYVQSVAGAF